MEKVVIEPTEVKKVKCFRGSEPKLGVVLYRMSVEFSDEDYTVTLYSTVINLIEDRLSEELKVVSDCIEESTRALEKLQGRDVEWAKRVKSSLDEFIKDREQLMKLRKDLKDLKFKVILTEAL